MSIRKSKFNIGEKVKVKDDLQEGRPSFVYVTKKMEGYAGLIVTIEDIYYDKQNDYFSYSIEEDDGKFFWEDSFFDDSHKDSNNSVSNDNAYKDSNNSVSNDNGLSLDVKFMRFMLGKASIKIEDKKELGKFYDFMTLLNLPFWNSLQLRQCIEITNKSYPLYLVIKDNSLKTETEKPTNLLLTELAKSNLEQLIALKTKSTQLMDICKFLPDEVDLGARRTIVYINGNRGTSVKHEDDSYDAVVGFSVALAKALFNTDYDGLQELLLTLEK